MKEESKGGSVPGHSTRVYRYWLRGDLPAAGIEELHRAHGLHNQLVELERAHAVRVAEVWSHYPEISKTDTAVEDAQARVTELKGLAAEQRKQTRKRRVTDELRDALKAAREELKEARSARRDAKTAFYDEAETEFTELNARKYAELKAARKEAVANGLYWSTANDVTAGHLRAVQAVNARRKSGRPAELRFRRWTGRGTLTIQLQRKAGEPPRLPSTIADTRQGKWRSYASLTPALDPEPWQAMKHSERERTGRGELRFRVGSGEHRAYIALPALVYPPIPIHADIVEMRITRNLVASKPRMTVAVTCRLPPAPSRAGGPMVACHTGWRSLPDGALRVAVVVGAGPPPTNLAHVARPHDGWVEVVFPARWRETAARGRELSSHRSLGLDALKSALAAASAANPTIDLEVAPADLQQWRSPGRFATLAIEHRDAGHPAAVLLEEWRRQDKKLWEREAHERDQYLARRTDAWRKVANWIVASAGEVRLDNWSVAGALQIPAIEDDDPNQHERARANLVLAAPGLLQSHIERVARREGVEVVRPKGRKLSTHLDCGQELDPGERADQVMVWCPTCEVLVDQDVNAATLLAQPDLRAVE